MAAIYRLHRIGGPAIFGPMSSSDPDVVNLAGQAVAQPGGAGDLSVTEGTGLAGIATMQPGGTGTLSVVSPGVTPTWPAGGTARIGPYVMGGRRRIGFQRL